MSIILDALKKSETESQQARAPGLFEARVAPPRRRLPLWISLVSALLLVNAIGLAWVLLRGSHGEVVTAPVAVAPGALPAPLAAAPVPDTPAALSVAQGPSPAAADVARSPAEESEDAAPNPGTARSDPGLDEDEAPAVPAAAQGGGSHVYRVEPAGASVPAGPPPPRGLPSYQEAASGGPLPELALNLHSWSSTPSERYILLNMVPLKEGQTSPQGVKVETITPDGAVLSYQGREFSLQR